MSTSWRRTVGVEDEGGPYSFDKVGLSIFKHICHQSKIHLWKLVGFFGIQKRFPVKSLASSPKPSEAIKAVQVLNGSWCLVAFVIISGVFRGHPLWCLISSQVLTSRWIHHALNHQHLSCSSTGDVTLVGTHQDRGGFWKHVVARIIHDGNSLEQSLETWWSCLIATGRHCQGLTRFLHNFVKQKSQRTQGWVVSWVVWTVGTMMTSDYVVREMIPLFDRQGPMVCPRHETLVNLTCGMYIVV